MPCTPPPHPGVKVQLPVLTEKDVEDVQKFACKNGMDFIAASFVQSADDVRFIRKTLDVAGGKVWCEKWFNLPGCAP